MRFGKTLRQSIYPPWKDKYIDYAKLKQMLREDRPEDEDEPWTEEDENRFCDEVFNVQLEKVAQFQAEKVEDLSRRVEAAFEKLKDMPSAEGEAGKEPQHATTATPEQLKELEAELDAITNEVKQLQKFSNINYTGFLKIVKKHDRKRGEHYKIRPIMMLSLSKRPFNSDQAYWPLLTKLSLMYFAIRQQLEEPGTVPEILPAEPDEQAEVHNGHRYTAHNFWVHPDNLLEVKTYILRRLPALIYSEQSAREADGQQDPTITSLYFDSPKFDLYANKVERLPEASSLRLRWYGQLNTKPNIYFEHKVLHENGSNEERRFAIKEKYIKAFLDGEYKMEKTIQKMERQGQKPEVIQQFRDTVDAIQNFIREKKLAPMIRANYRRNAFQNPQDDRVRISIDTDIAFIREDALDRDRPCRDPKNWHRLDIDSGNLTYPFSTINQSEVSRFPYAVLEIKLKEDSNRRRPAWVQDLMASHLVHPCPRFSKFVHGTASLFEDYVNRLPFWLADLDTDIRKDPQTAFEEEESRRAQQAETEQVVGSFLGTKIGSYKPSHGSPIARSYLAERAAADASATPRSHTFPTDARASTASLGGDHSLPGDIDAEQSQNGGGGGGLNYGTLSSIFPGFSLSKYSRARRAREALLRRRRDSLASLPPGVVEPTEWIKNSGPLQIEPKVWLANERTFLKWQHITVLLGGLALSLYSAGGAGRDDALARWVGVGLLAVAGFAAAWSSWVVRKRRNMIVQRSGKDFDFVLGPLVVSAALGCALVVNFVLAYERYYSQPRDSVDAGLGAAVADAAAAAAATGSVSAMGDLRI
ncbi:hypothetical protein VTJ04DRAFT_9250 [Mycothermus thermophilus]|uniref:uncharacterized protein n=1 Tax=Humicola insolens TaxID=85995 RepID=UPI0037442404